MNFDLIVAGVKTVAGGFLFGVGLLGAVDAVDLLCGWLRRKGLRRRP